VISVSRPRGGGGNTCSYTFNFTNSAKPFFVYSTSDLPRTQFSSFPQQGKTSGVFSISTSGWTRGTYYYSTGPNDPAFGYFIVEAGPVDGGWSGFDVCSRSCDGGQLMRTCTNPKPVGSGLQCQGAVYNGQTCNTNPCGCKIDVMYVLDGSGSIDGTSWQNLKNFATALSVQLEIGNGSTGGVVQFSGFPPDHPYQIEYETDLLPPAGTAPRMLNNLALVQKAINDMHQYGGYTAIGEGLKVGQLGLVQAGRWGLEPPIPKVILLITDGMSNCGESPEQASLKIRKNGTEIFIIGVGDINQTELVDTCTPPAFATGSLSAHYFNVSGYDDLYSVASAVAYSLCYGRSGAAPATLYLLFLLLLPAAASVGFCLFVYRRRRPKKVEPPPPVVPPPEPEPEPVPVKAAAPAPVVDKPKDWTVPGTRYIGFGQANIKVKWGADAPPSAPRGHDKYDRWSMHANPGGPPPASASPVSAAPAASAALTPMETQAAPEQPGQPAVGGDSCCMRFCPCFFGAAAGGAFAANRSQMAKNNNKDEEGGWQENAATPTSQAAPATPAAEPAAASTSGEPAPAATT